MFLWWIGCVLLYIFGIYVKWIILQQGGVPWLTEDISSDYSMCGKGIDCYSISTIFLLGFGTCPWQCGIFCFSLYHLYQDNNIILIYFIENKSELSHIKLSTIPKTCICIIWIWKKNLNSNVISYQITSILKT